jgi:hypothetical protein
MYIRFHHCSQPWAAKSNWRINWRQKDDDAVMRQHSSRIRTAFVTHQNETRCHPAAFLRHCRLPAAPLPPRLVTQRLKNESRFTAKSKSKRPRFGNKNPKTKQETSTTLTQRLIALASGAICSGSNLSSPVDAGYVAAEDTGNDEGKARIVRRKESAYVIMTMKLNESATARPACMPSKPYLPTHTPRKKNGGKQTHVGRPQCSPLLYAQNSRDWDSDGPVREDIGDCSDHLLATGAENTRAHAADGVQYGVAAAEGQHSSDFVYNRNAFAEYVAPLMPESDKRHANAALNECNHDEGQL